MTRSARVAAVLLALAAAGHSLGLPTAVAEPMRIIAFGDAATAPRPEVELVYAARLQQSLDLVEIDAEVINAGVGGDTTPDARRRLVSDVIDRSPDIVIVQFGLNDAMVDLDRGRSRPRVSKNAFRANLRFFTRELQRRGAEVILMTPNPMLWTTRLRERLGQAPYDPGDRWGLNRLHADYAAIVREVARDLNAPLVDVMAFFEEFDAALEEQRADELLLDGIHPNDAGHRYVADLLLHEVLALRNSGALGRRRALAEADRPPLLGYTLPLIDLADETHRQVVVDREAGQYLGHPTTVLLEDGHTLIAVYPKGHGRGAIVMKRSEDGGRTWSDRLPVPESWATSKETPTIHRVIDPETGARRLILFSGLHPIRMATSEDDGRSWSPLASIGDYGGIVAMAGLVRLRGGDYLAFFHDDGRFIDGRGQAAPAFTIYQVRSSDGGLSWSRPQAIWTGSDVHLCEPGVVRSPDGSTIALLLRENRRRRNAHVMFSTDEGSTWSTPRELPGALTGDRHTARYAPDGRLVISFRDTTLESPTKGDWVAWVGSWEDIAQGREGRYRVRLMDNHHRWDCAYPGVEVLPDGTFVATTYGHWVEGEPPYIVSVRFTLAELDARGDGP